MRSSRVVTSTLAAALWACSASELPPDYARLEVPEERLVSEAARARGGELFLANCALCHGERGDGRGRRRNLSTPPKNLTDPYWQARSSPRALFFTIREGRDGTAMPAFKSLSTDEVWDLVSFIGSLSGNEG
jgi:mono/diheme cytochrome c family protein